MMGLQRLFEEKTDVDQLGIHLQIVDDVLDYRDDVVAGDQNCLTADKRDEYLTSLVQTFDETQIKSLFPYGGILTYAISKARQQAEDMLKNPSSHFFLAY